MKLNEYVGLIELRAIDLPIQERVEFYRKMQDPLQMNAQGLESMFYPLAREY